MNRPTDPIHIRLVLQSQLTCYRDLNARLVPAAWVIDSVALAAAEDQADERSAEQMFATRPATLIAEIGHRRQRLKKVPRDGNAR